MTERYRLSFTTGGLFLREAPVVVECYLRYGNWAEARDHVRQANLLQVRTAAAATRISKEVTARLETLDSIELQALIDDSSLRDQAYLLWVAACRRYTFIRDFAIEVLREHFLVQGVHRTQPGHVLGRLHGLAVEVGGLVGDAQMHGGEGGNRKREGGQARGSGSGGIRCRCSG